MTTLKITVDNRKHAQLLTKLLKTMAFVKIVEEEIPVVPLKDQLSETSTLIQLKGLGKDIWNKTDVAKYISTERESWDKSKRYQIK